MKKINNIYNLLLKQSVSEKLFASSLMAFEAIKTIVQLTLDILKSKEPLIQGFFTFEQAVNKLAKTSREKTFLFNIPNVLITHKLILINKANTIFFDLCNSVTDRSTEKLKQRTREQLAFELENAINELSNINTEKRILLLTKLMERIDIFTEEKKQSKENSFVALLPFILSDKAKELANGNNKSDVSKIELSLNNEE